MRVTATILLLLIALAPAYPLGQAFTVHVIRLPLYYGKPPDTLGAAPAIDILGLSWRKTALTVQIVQASFVPSADYYTAVENAFAAWDQALASFGSQYGYPYLSQFSFSTSIVSAASTGYDITVEFTSATAVAGGEIGEALISYIGGTILSVKITLYLYVSGIGTLSPTDIYNIALHEIGHALGLNHAAQSTTTNGPEVMYPYYSFPGYAMSPTTLDAYALSEVYAWLSSGVYSTVAAQTVYLPSTIPYEEIQVSVTPLTPLYKVTVLSPVDLVVGAGLYPQGATVTLRVTRTVYVFNNGTRLVFAGWTGAINSTSPVVTVTVTGNMVIKAVWKKQYLVRVPTMFGVSCGKPGWYDPGSKVTFRVSKTVYVFSNGTRLVFQGWGGDVHSDANSVTIVVDKPVTIYPIWKKQYLVEVETRYANANIRKEWVDAGKEVVVKLDNEVVNLGNGTRLVHVGWRGDVNATGPVLRVRVDRPLRVEPVWKKQYLVEVETGGLVEANINVTWADAGSRLLIFLRNETVNLGNGTRLVHVGWTGDVKSSNLTLVISVDRPIHVKPVWRREYLLKMSGVYVGLTAKSGWYPEGEKLAVKPLKTIVYHDNGTRHVFAGWLVDGRRVSNITLELPVDKPHVVKALWRTQYRTEVYLRDAQGRPLNFTAVISMNATTITLTPLNATGVWLDRGTWTIRVLNYTSPELVGGLGSMITGRKRVVVTETCRGDCGSLTIDKPGNHTVTLNIYNVTLRVEGPLGLPAPGLTVIIGGRKYISDLDGFLVQRLIDGGSHEAAVYLAGIKLGSAEVTINGSGETVVKTDVPVYPALASLALLAALAAARRLLPK